MVLALAVLSLVGIAAERARAVIWIMDGLLFFAVIFDRLRTPAPKALEVARDIPERAGLTVSFERQLLVGTQAAAGLQLEVREEFSPHFDVLARSVNGIKDCQPLAQDPTGGPDVAVLADGKTLFKRSYSSRTRGSQELGDLRLRLRGPLGLIQRQAFLRGSQRILIDPPLAGLSRILKLAASERWHDLGVRRLRRRGGLTEFESLREYVHGDELNLIDWKAFARRGRPIVREFQEERGQELIVLVDGGRRMGATTASGDHEAWTKLDHAIDTGLELAAVALQAGDRVGFAIYDHRLRVYVPPVKGRRQLGRIKEAVFAELPSGRDSDLGRALRELSLLHRRRALLVIVSDVADTLSVDLQREALNSGSRRHSLVLATLDDPSVRAIAEGELAASAAERAVAFALLEERNQALQILRRASARVLDTLPAESAGPLLGAWLDARRGSHTRR
ncbi:MAG: hypothetical protein ACI8X5_002098 [Planctomycetota bacterium]